MQKTRIPTFCTSKCDLSVPSVAEKQRGSFGDCGMAVEGVCSVLEVVRGGSQQRYA